MKLNVAKMACVLVLAGWMVAPASADLITGVTATDNPGSTYDYSWAPWAFYPNDAVNGAGLSTVGGKLVHTSNDGATPATLDNGQQIINWNQWTSGAVVTKGIAAGWQANRYDNEALTVDLGATYNVGSFHLWNYNVAGVVGRGMEYANIYTSTNGTDWTKQVGDQADGTWLFAEATGTDDYEGQQFNLAGAWSGIRYVKIENVMTYEGNQSLIGLSEVQFFTATPEPATMVLLAIGGLAALRRGKR
jgi:hypothetical protein